MTKDRETTMNINEQVDQIVKHSCNCGKQCHANKVLRLVRPRLTAVLESKDLSTKELLEWARKAYIQLKQADEDITDFYCSDIAELLASAPKEILP